MLNVRYKNDINQFLLEFENWNVKAKVTRIALRTLIRDQIPDEAVRRMSIHQEYADDRDWIEALRQAVRDDEDFLEGKGLITTISQDQTQERKGNVTSQQRQRGGKNQSIPRRRKGYTRRRKKRRR